MGMTKIPGDIEGTKRLMGALVRMKPKPHEDMKVGKKKKTHRGKSGTKKNPAVPRLIVVSFPVIGQLYFTIRTTSAARTFTLSDATARVTASPADKAGIGCNPSPGEKLPMWTAPPPKAKLNRTL
jgi:zona occludens toxin (predicted ATPase)